jgi:hypothetical protein
MHFLVELASRNAGAARYVPVPREEGGIGTLGERSHGSFACANDTNSMQLDVWQSWLPILMMTVGP